MKREILLIVICLVLAMGSPGYATEKEDAVKSLTKADAYKGYVFKQVETPFALESVSVKVIGEMKQFLKVGDPNAPKDSLVFDGKTYSFATLSPEDEKKATATLKEKVIARVGALVPVKEESNLELLLQVQEVERGWVMGSDGLPLGVLTANIFILDTKSRTILVSCGPVSVGARSLESALSIMAEAAEEKSKEFMKPAKE